MESLGKGWSAFGKKKWRDEQNGRDLENNLEGWPEQTRFGWNLVSGGPHPETAPFYGIPFPGSQGAVYTEFALQLLVSGLISLGAMIGAIVLSLSKSNKQKKT